MLYINIIGAVYASCMVACAILTITTVRKMSRVYERNMKAARELIEVQEKIIKNLKKQIQ